MERKRDKAGTKDQKLLVCYVADFRKQHKVQEIACTDNSMAAMF